MDRLKHSLTKEIIVAVTAMALVLIPIFATQVLSISAPQAAVAVQTTTVSGLTGNYKTYTSIRDYRTAIPEPYPLVWATVTAAGAGLLLWTTSQCNFTVGQVVSYEYDRRINHVTLLNVPSDCHTVPNR